MNIISEHQCRERIEKAIEGVAPDDAMAALITALVDLAMTFDKEGEPISPSDVKLLLREVVGQVVDLCFSFDGPGEVS